MGSTKTPAFRAASCSGELVKLEIKNKIATVEFYHPKSNSLPPYLLEEMTEKFYQLSHDEDVNVVILKSEGEKAFCAGASFDELIRLIILKMEKNFLWDSPDLLIQ